MEKTDVNQLQLLAKKIRLHTIKCLANQGFGHYGGSLSIVETLAVLYGKAMKIDPKEPQMPDRDYFILSKGHAGPAYYAALALRGYFDTEELMTLNKNGTNLPSHPDRLLTNGVDMTTGSLGQGISVACGVAKALQLDDKDQYVYSIVGDGELDEGQCWEAVQFASHNKLDNLIVFLDNNKKQLDGYIKDICNGFSYKNKFESFGFHVQEVDGADIEAIYEAIKCAKGQKGCPHMIVLDTVKGQGFPLMEEKLDNHHVRPSEDEKLLIKDFIKQLEQELGGETNV